MRPDKKKSSRWPIAASLFAHCLFIGFVLSFAVFGTREVFPEMMTVSIVSVMKGDPAEGEVSPKTPPRPQTVLKPDRTKPRQPENKTIEEAQIRTDSAGQTVRSEMMEAVQAVSSSMSEEEDGGQAQPGEESAGSQATSSGAEFASTASQDELAGFLSQVRQIIEHHKQYPWRARFQGLEGTAQLRFRILPTGEPTDIQVIQSSRSAMLDEESIATVKRVTRFPEPPVKSPMGIWIRLPFVFHLEEGG